ncbi:hypothetical protein [Phenylobacterium sp.]|uniref:hypothetical protein n=1 Tax=Phenylobacterium sp. TaxID=1871053 RepID=UPI0025F08351|nr:hypothetical protein [Phenylobacterium sp.]MBX3485128.1 hypothetical protein [Phenylobacterium sp.]MCW5759195.1 hypothetical protein [Phenylobacterium sp.]
MTAPRPTLSVLRAALQEDFHSFIRPAFDTLNPGQAFQPNWHIEAIAHALSEVGRGDINRLLITMPPRYLKSICGSVAFPAWMMGRDPTLRFLVASYSAELATKHARDFRSVVESGWFRTFFPNFGRLKRVADAEITTAQNGSRRSVSLGGSVTGFGADILIIDDLMKAADASSPVERQRVKDFYDQTLFSRLDDKQDGCIIAIQQRLHEDDLAGYLLEKGGNWVHLNLPAIAEEDEEIPLGPRRRHFRRRGDALFPSREPIGTLESIRLEIGAPAFSAQYQQSPVSLDSAHVRWDRIQTYEEPYDRVGYTQVVQSWDTAMHGGDGPQATRALRPVQLRKALHLAPERRGALVRRAILRKRLDGGRVLLPSGNRVRRGRRPAVEARLHLARLLRRERRQLAVLQPSPLARPLIGDDPSAHAYLHWSPLPDV